MTNIAVQKVPNAPASPAPSTYREWDPFRALRDIARWDPFARMAPLRSGFSESGFTPAVEIKETPEEFVFTADLPGVKADDLEVSLTQNRLTISGERESERNEKTDTYYTYERSYGRFSRAFDLPHETDANAVHAELTSGVLMVRVPKKAVSPPQKVPVTSK
jgi:HSP20 family protein